MNQQKMTGQCHCGAVEYTGLGDLPELHCCHCPDCMRWAGGPLMALHFSGGIQIADPAAVNWYQSSDWAERGSCKTCGSALFWRLRADHGMTVATAGSLDRHEKLSPIAEHIYIDAKPPWYDFAGDAPCLTSTEFLARLQGR